MNAKARIHSQFESSYTTSKRLEGVQVLVVDDDPDARELVGIIMEQQSASILLAESVAEALDEIQKRKVDVLICDIGMPVQDGYSLIKQLRERGPEQGGQIPAMALTAFSQPADLSRILQSGYQICLCKPVDPTDLVEAVIKLHGKLKSPQDDSMGGAIEPCMA